MIDCTELLDTRVLRSSCYLVLTSMRHVDLCFDKTNNDTCCN